MKPLSEKELILLKYLEGELDGAAKQEAEALMAEDALMEMDYVQLAKTKIQPDTSIVYGGKNSLKRTVGKEKAGFGFILWPVSIAACLALMILFYNPAQKTTGEQVAAKTGNQEIKTSNNPVTPFTNGNEKQVVEAKGAPAQKQVKTVYGTTKQVQETTAVITAPKHEMEEIAQQPVIIPQMAVVIPGPVYPNLTNQQLPGIIEPDGPITKQGLLAQVKEKANHLLGYLQKPKVKIDKKETETGRDYLAISIEAEKYDIEGRIYNPLR